MATSKSEQQLKSENVEVGLHHGAGLAGPNGLNGGSKESESRAEYDGQTIIESLSVSHQI